MEYLEKIDNYGLKPNFRTFGKAQFNTWVGGVLTLLSLVLVAAASLLFGQDFWFKTNPKVISREVVPEKSEFIYPTSKSFTIMFRLEDNFANQMKNPDEIIVAEFYYSHMRRDSQGNWEEIARIIEKGTKCSETLAVENPNLPNMDLSQIDCIDWEDIERQVNETREEGEELYKPILGGSWEEDEIGYFGVMVTNLKVGPDGEYILTEYKKIQEFLQDPKYISIFYPESLFDSSNLENPINRYWRNYLYFLNPQISRIDRFFLSLVKLEDDQGWIFEDVSESLSVTRVEAENEIRINDSETETEVEYNFYGLAIYLRRPQKGLRRSYMKIQELGALVGGFIKAVQVVFVFISFRFAEYRRTLFIYEELNNATPNKIIKQEKNNLSLSNNYMKNPNIVLKTRKKLNIGFFRATFSFCFKNKFESEKYKNFKQFVQKNVDIQTIFELNQNVSSFVEDLKKLNIEK